MSEEDTIGFSSPDKEKNESMEGIMEEEKEKRFTGDLEIVEENSGEVDDSNNGEEENDEMEKKDIKEDNAKMVGSVITEHLRTSSTSVDSPMSPTIPEVSMSDSSIRINPARASEILSRKALDQMLGTVTHFTLPPSYLKHTKEDIMSDKWRNRAKHVFISSEAGKPIFTRFGNESDLNPMMAFFTTILSHIEHHKDVIRTIYGDKGFKITFLSKGALNFISITRTTESSKEVAKQLNYIYLSLVLVLTEKLQEVLKRKKSFDLRSLLGGTDASLYSLISTMSNYMTFTIKSYPCIRLNKKHRSIIGTELSKFRTTNLLYLILLSGDRVVHVARNKKRNVKPEDLLLLMNFVTSSRSFRTHEIWTPLCLPGLTPVGYVYAYVDFWEKVDNDLCIVIVNADASKFFECSKMAEKVRTRLNASNTYNEITEAIKTKYRTYSVEEMKISPKDVCHFVYKNAKNQYTDCSFAPPYNLRKEKKRIIRLYKNMREKALYSNANYKIVFQKTRKESLLVWISNSVEYYVTFSLAVGKKQALEYCERIKKWIKTEDSLFFDQVTF